MQVTFSLFCSSTRCFVMNIYLTIVKLSSDPPISLSAYSYLAVYENDSEWIGLPRSNSPLTLHPVGFHSDAVPALTCAAPAWLISKTSSTSPQRRSRQLGNQDLLSSWTFKKATLRLKVSSGLVWIQPVGVCSDSGFQLFTSSVPELVRAYSLPSCLKPQG